uniref:CCHC-type domain-containing protein n=1 Tax=Chenopodium quinoa TaxID=63459 RepID=A0A803MVZ3_CHEQI
MKMKENEDIKGYTSRFKEVVNQMKIYGEEISDAKIVQKILGSLDRRFNTMSTIIVESKDVTKLSVTELMGSLLAHEQKFAKDDLGKSPPLEIAFSSKSHKKFPFNKGNNRKNQGAPRSDRKDKEQPQSKGKFPPCGICNKTNHLEKDCYHKGKPKCSHCKKLGHLEKDCWYKQKQQSSNTNARASNESEDNLFYERQVMSSFPVRMGNGVVVQSTGKGTIGVQTKKGMKFINDVLLVPDLNDSLLSVAQMVNNGYSLVFENNHCTIIDSNKKEIVKNLMENNNFLLKWDYPVKNMNVVNSSDTWLWHRRSKLDAKAERGISLGYDSQAKEYRFFNLSNKKIMISRDVKFDEDASWNWEEEKVEKKFFQVDSEVHDEPRDENIEEAPSTPIQAGNGTEETSDDDNATGPRGKKSLSDLYEKCPVFHLDPQECERCYLGVEEPQHMRRLLNTKATRPDLMFAPSLLSRFTSEPSDVHMGAARRVL